MAAHSALCGLKLFQFPINLSRTAVISSPTALQILPVRLMSATKTIPPMKRPAHRPNRHRHPLWRRARADKNWKIELQDYEFQRRRERDQVSPEEAKVYMKKLGLKPPPASPYTEKPTYISSTGTLLDSYVPPEGDGKASLVSTTKAKQLQEAAFGKGKTMSSVRKIRKYDEDFDPRVFAEEAQQIYIDAHRALAEQDEDELHKFATEKCHPEMMNMARRKTIRWNFIKSLEPPRVVHARHAEILTKENMFGQLTVRFHTQQTLAVYDRFGRLIHGNEMVAKDVLEYVVFEKHLSNIYGTWRMHAKIIPDWMPPREPGRLTTLVKKEKRKEAKSEEKGETEGKTDVEKEKEKHSNIVQEEEESLYDRFGRMIGRK